MGSYRGRGNVARVRICDDDHMPYLSQEYSVSDDDHIPYLRISSGPKCFIMLS